LKCSSREKTGIAFFAAKIFSDRLDRQPKTVARPGNGAYRPGKSGGDSESTPTRNLWLGQPQDAGAEPAASPKHKKQERRQIMTQYAILRFAKMKGGAEIEGDATSFTGLTGCCLFGIAGADNRSRDNLQGKALVPSPHEGIIPSNL